MQPRDRLHYLLIPVASLVAVIPLIVNGCSCGHDFDFHILSWLEAARQFAQGNFHPHWAYTPAYNAGEPRFVFYPPLSWTIGAILGLILPWTWAPIAYSWLILTAAGFTLRRLAGSYAAPTAATLAAVFYLVNPYMLFTAYERTAYAELLAAVWIPLLLHGILRPDDQGGVTIPRIAIPVALLWLTNAPAAVMSCYALALLALIRVIQAPASPAIDPRTGRRIAQSRLIIASNAAAGTALGLGLAAFYIMPAAYERRYVQIAMAVLPGLRVQDNTLFHHYAATITDPAAISDAILHDTVLHTASLIALILITITTVVLVVAVKQNTNPGHSPLSPNSSGAPCFAYLAKRGNEHVSRTILYPLAIITTIITLLLTPISLPIWNHVPELAFLQFPWRTVAILAAVLALATALALRNKNLKPTPTAAIALIIAAALVVPAYKTFHQPCDEEDSVSARVSLFHSNRGTDPTDEYTPTTADNDALSRTNPPYWLSPNPNAPAPTSETPGPAPQSLTLKSATVQTLILNLRDYPAWHVTLNNALVITRQQRDDGLIAISIPTGPAQINITYTRLRDQTNANTITILCLLILVTILLRREPSAITGT